MSTETRTGHTPGPWTWHKKYGPDGQPDHRFWIDSDTLMLADVAPCAAMSVEESHANARLIAAAPELLGFLTFAFDESSMSELASHLRRPEAELTLAHLTMLRRDARALLARIDA